MAFNRNTFQTSNVVKSNAKEIEIPNPPTDTISCLRFSTAALPQTYLLAGSWDKSVRIWEIMPNGEIILRTQQTLQAQVLDCCWSQDCTKAFISCTDKAGYMWDIGLNQVSQIAVHDMPIKTIHYIQAPNYSCVMTGSWDKTLKFWDMKSSSPSISFNLSGKVYAADVHYPMAVVATSDNKISVYNLENQPSEFKQFDSKFKSQTRCIKVYLDKVRRTPAGFIMGCIEGRVGIQSVPENPKESFTFKCHRTPVTASNTQDIFAVNDVLLHPVYQTVVTMGSDGIYTFWDKDARTKLKSPENKLQQSLTAGAIDSKGNIFAFATGYDWSKGHEYNDDSIKPKIFIRECNDDLTPTNK